MSNNTDHHFDAIVIGAGMTGGWAAAHFASKYEKADVWAYRLLVVIVILAILKIFNIHTLFYS